MIGGYQFIFNGRRSEDYFVSLVFIDNSYTNRISGGDKELVTASIRRNPVKQYLDTEYPNVLKFDIEIVFDDAVDIYQLTDLKNWLFSPVSYEELQICAENFERYYYNCIIHPKEDLIYGDGYRGVSATVECDAPYAYEFETVVKHNLDYIFTQKTQFNFINYSDDFELMAPKIQFHMTRYGDVSINVKHYSENKYMVNYNSTIVLNNVSYNKCIVYCRMNQIPTSAIEKSLDYDVTTTFVNLNAGDTVYMDNKNCIITLNNDPSSNIFSRFNRKFFKLPRGLNIITVEGNASYLYIAYQNAKRLGGSYY